MLDTGEELQKEQLGQNRVMARGVGWCLVDHSEHFGLYSGGEREQVEGFKQRCDKMIYSHWITLVAVR